MKKMMFEFSGFNSQPLKYTYSFMFVTLVILLILLAVWQHDVFGQVGDTTLIGEGEYDVSLGNGRHVRVIGDVDVYRDTVGVLKRGTWEVKDTTSGTYTMRIKEDLTVWASKNPAGFRIERNDKYVEFWLMTNVFRRFNATTLTKVHRGFRWTIADGSYYQLNAGRGGFKETIYAVGKRNTFNVFLNTNINRIGRAFERFQVLKLTAEDSTGRTLAISDSFIVRSDSTFFQAIVDTMGALFPITVDPSIMDSTLAAEAGYLRVDDATWLVARNATTAEIVGSPGFAGVQTSYIVMRYYTKHYYNIVSLGNIDSVYYRFYQIGKAITQAQNFLLVSSQHTELVVNQYTKFVGWQAANAYTGIKALGNIPSSVITADNQWYNIKFVNQAALDTVKAHNGDTLKLLLTGTIDSSGTAPIGHSSIYISSTAPPRLLIWYTEAPLTQTLVRGLNYDSLKVLLSDSVDYTAYDSLRVFKVVGSDTLPMTGFVKAFNVWLDTLSVDTRYVLKTRLYGADSLSTEKDTIRTAPAQPTISVWSVNHISLGVSVAKGIGNPDTIKISIKDSTRSDSMNHNLWLTLAGDTSTVQRFFTVAQWGSVTTTGWDSGDVGIYVARAQNLDSTAFSKTKVDSASTAPVLAPSAPIFSLPITMDSVYQLRLVPDDAANDSAGSQYAFLWSLPLDSAGKWLTSNGCASLSQTWKHEIDWRYTLINLRYANRQCAMFTVVRSVGDTVLRDTSFVVGSKYTRIPSPDSLVYTKWNAIAAWITSIVWGVSIDTGGAKLAVRDITRYPKRWHSTAGVLIDSLTDSSYASPILRKVVGDLVPGTENALQVMAKNVDSVTSGIDTTHINFVIPGVSGGGGGGSGDVTTAQLADSIAAHNSYSQLLGLDSNQVFIAVLDTSGGTPGGIVYRKLRELLGYIGF
uniref:Uncharacterized protein n=1 Tax=viral metagenome TaxID=1070528 RepID=A0A6M3IE25_9ZZZZ